MRAQLGRYGPTCFNQAAIKCIVYTYRLHMKSLFIGYDYPKLTDETFSLASEAHFVARPFLLCRRELWLFIKE